MDCYMLRYLCSAESTPSLKGGVEVGIGSADETSN
jgi:hypothetical protein